MSNFLIVPGFFGLNRKIGAVFFIGFFWILFHCSGVIEDSRPSLPENRPRVKKAEASKSPIKVISQLEIQDQTPIKWKGLSLPEPQVEAIFNGSLAEKGYFQMVKTGPGYKVRLTYGVSLEEMTPKRGVSVMLSLDFLHPLAAMDEAEKRYSYKELLLKEIDWTLSEAKIKEAVYQMLKEGITENYLKAVFEISAKYKSTADLIKELDSSKRFHVQIAILSLGERKDKAAFVPLLNLMEKGDEDIASRVMGALVKYGDPQVIEKIIKVSQGKSDVFLAFVLEAISALKGKQALDFLKTLSRGHPNPAIRGKAEEILKKLNPQ